MFFSGVVMFRMFRDKRIIGLSLILIGLGILLLIPKLTEASTQAPLYTIDETSIAFHCQDCVPVQQRIAPQMIRVIQPQSSEPCDVCHTETIDVLDEDIARANQLESDLRQASTQAIVLQGHDTYGELQLNRIAKAIELLDTAQTALDAGQLDEAAQLLATAHNLLGDVEDTAHLNNAWAGLFMPLAIFATGSCSGKCKYAQQFNLFASSILAQDNSSSSILVFENSLTATYNPSAMHRRAPPADEDAMIITDIYLFWHGRLSHFGAQSPFYLPSAQSYSCVNNAVATVQPPFLGIL